MKTTISIFLASIFLMSCTVTVPDYVSSLTQESTFWTTINQDSTLPEIGLFTHYDNGKLVANLTCYVHPDSIAYIQNVNVTVSEFETGHIPLYLTYGEFPGTTKFYQQGADYVEMRDLVINECDVLACQQINFIASRSYTVIEEELPEVIHLMYTITTAKWGESSGSLQFTKATREYQETMRFH